RKRGVFATRAPYRPNPIGMSVLRLEGIEGLTLHVRDVDMLDGTPVLDIKPYVRYADAVPEATDGWIVPLAGLPGSPGEPLDPIADPEPGFQVVFAQDASTQLEFLREHQGIDLEPRLHQALRLRPTPHAYRRIRKLAH